MADQDVDEKKLLDNARKLPPSEQLAHKNWKVRQQLYDDIKDACGRASSTDDGDVAGYGVGLFAKAVSDTNAAAQDRALEALAAYLRIANESTATQIAESCCHHIVSKALKGRASTVKFAMDVFMLLVELDQQALVVEALVKGVGDKVPKVVNASVDILAAVVSEYGAKVVSPGPIIKALPTLFNHKDGKVRNTAKTITVILAQWAGAATIKSTVCEKMPDAMKKEVEKEIDDLPKGKPTATRLTRKEMAKRNAAADAAAPLSAVDGGGAAVGGGRASVVDTGPVPMDVDDDNDGMDAYDLVEASDVLNSLGKDFYKQLVDPKWTIRKGALQHLKSLASQPRLAPGDYGELLRELKKIVTKDSNVVCQAETIGCYGALAKGLRKDFATPARQLAGVLLDKLKEKNAGVTAACKDALDAMHRYCFSFGEIVEDVAVALEHKNPKVRGDTLQLVGTMLLRESRESVVKLLPTLAPVVVKNALEASPELRDAAMLTLCALAVKMGKLDKALTKYTDKMDDTRSKRLQDLVKEALETGSMPTTTSGGALLTARGPRMPSITTAGTQQGRDSQPNTASSRGSSSNGSFTARGRPAGGSGGGVVTARGTKSANTAAPTTTIPTIEDDTPLSSDDAVACIAERFGASTVTMLSDTDWKQRKAAMETIVQEVENNAPSHVEATSAIIAALATTPGWGEKNFQVVQLVLRVCTHLAQHSSTFGRRDAGVVINGVHEKMSDVKVKGPGAEALTAMSEAVGPLFVCNQLHTKAAAHKNPKVLSESLLWIATCIDEFGLGVMDVKTLVEWAKTDLGSSTPAIRTAAITMVVSMHKQLGDGLVPMLADHIKPALMVTVEGMLAKNPKDAGYAPTRRVRKAPSGGKGGGSGNGVAITAVAGVAAGRNAARGASGRGGVHMPDVEMEDVEDGDPPVVNMDDLLPRTDISGQVNGELLGMLNSGQPKERMKGVDAVDAVLKGAGGRVGPDVGDLIPALKGRLSDSNKNLVAHVCNTLGDLARAMGAPFSQQMRPLVMPALANLNDSKKHVREAVIAMLDAWVTVVPADRFLPQLADTITPAKCNPDGKRVAMTWLTSQVDSKTLSSVSDIESLLRICASAVKDKKNDVRADGEALVAAIVGKCGHGDVTAATGGLDAATKTIATEVLQKHMAMAPAPAAAHVPRIPSAAGLRGEEGGVRPLTARGGGGAAGHKRGGGHSRGGTSAGGASAGGGMSVGDIDGCLLVVNDRKEDRARKLLPRLRASAGKYEPRLDDLPSLENDMQPYVSDTLRSLLFHKDFRKHMEGASMLLDTATQDPPAALSCLDLLLRWIVLRQADTNTQCLLKLLELAKVLLVLLQEQEMELSELELLVLVPCLIEKSGHNQDRIRAMYRDLIQASCCVASVQRVLEMLLVCAQYSKNNRSRVEACEEVGNILGQYGLTIATGLKHKPLPICAQLVSDRDKTLRSASLGVLSQVYMLEGTAVWKHIGRVTPQQHSLIEERFRHLTKQQGGARGRAVSPGGHRKGGSMAASEYSSGTGSPRSRMPSAHQRGASSLSSSSFHEGPARLETPGVSSRGPLRGPISPDSPRAGHVRRVSSMGGPGQDITPLPGQLHGGPSGAGDGRTEAEVEEQWSSGIVMLHSEDPVEYSDGMKMLNYVLKEAHDGNLGQHVMATLAASANELVLEVNNKLDEAVRSAMATTDTQAQKDWARVAKYALNILMLAFPMGAIARSLSLASLRHTVATVLVLLLDDAIMSTIFQGEAMLKAMNVMMLKVLENCDKTLAYIALLQLLRAPPPSVATKGPDAAARFSDLIVKCLIKLTKTLPVCIDTLDVDQLLCSIHEYFTELGLDEIRKRGSSEDKPLRMMKTLLHELCKHLGFAIRDCLSLIPNDTTTAEGGEPLIFAYIELNLQTLAAAGLLPNAENVPVSPRIHAGYGNGRGMSGGGGVSRFSPMQVSPTTEMNKRLASIFGKIADANTAQAGMEELYQFRCDHPDVILEQHPSIASKSTQFQQFVLKGLQAIEQREAATSPNGGGSGGRGGHPSMSPPPQASTPGSGGGLLSLGGLQKRMAAFRMGGGA